MFFKSIWNMLCLCHHGPALLRFWFQTDLGAKIHPVQAGQTFSYHGHALVTLYVQFLYSDCSKFNRWVHAEKLCSILKAEADRVLCQLVMFLTVFFHWMYKMKYSCYQEKYVACQSRNPISDSIVFVFHLAWCIRGLKSLKRFWRCLIAFGSCISNGKPE